MVAPGLGVQEVGLDRIERVAHPMYKLWVVAVWNSTSALTPCQDGAELVQRLIFAHRIRARGFERPQALVVDLPRAFQQVDAGGNVGALTSVAQIHEQHVNA